MTMIPLFHGLVGWVPHRLDLVVTMEGVTDRLDLVVTMKLSWVNLHQSLYLAMTMEGVVDRLDLVVAIEKKYW